MFEVHRPDRTGVCELTVLRAQFGWALMVGGLQSNLVDTDG